MNKRMIRIVFAALIIAGALSVVISGPAMAQSNTTLADVTANCAGFSLTATFQATIAEEIGSGPILREVSHVRLRVIDSGGNVVYVAAPWEAYFPQSRTVEFSAVYAQPPVAGPLLFILEDYVQLEVRQLQSRVTAIVFADCDTFPQQEQPNVLLSCNARLRTGPGLNYRWRKILWADSTITVLGRLFDSTWLQVRVDESGRIGWVFNGLCLPGSPEEGTYSGVPVTFFRTPEEVILYQAGLQ